MYGGDCARSDFVDRSVVIPEGVRGGLTNMMARGGIERTDKGVHLSSILRREALARQQDSHRDCPTNGGV